MPIDESAEAAQFSLLTSNAVSPLYMFPTPRTKMQTGTRDAKQQTPRWLASFGINADFLLRDLDLWMECLS